ncbi:MAG: FAD-binding protein [Lentisphaeria bacterium]|nr:FAD-binding protein [Lentisphaeria bacterium]
MKKTTLQVAGQAIPSFHIHTLVIGSGAAGLNAAVQLNAGGVDDLLIISEGLQMGTSINTGSDKQTYYKIAMNGDENDSPASLAQSFFGGGSMHGDLALIEAALSGRAFLNLVNLGVPFPRDRYGQFVGYKTDHDPLQRATSVGPYTSREMCRTLIREIGRRGIECRENRVVTSLITVDENGAKRAAGAVVVNRDASSTDTAFEVYTAENVVFATGGPGGLYKTSVYPNVHTGGIGLALMAGAKAQSLPESQYGMASTKFRWNVSGTYMQVVPKFISTTADGETDVQEFLRPYFDTVGDMNTAIFLKGYQWPFDPRKVIGGSSIVDILVYIETVIKGRRVFMDFRENCAGFACEDLGEEAYSYLKNSDALFGKPIDRLQKMNPKAIELYQDHGIHLVNEPLEIAVCAQHNNGGLAGNLWWESTNIKHLFPVGEVNGSHGVYRPGGSALNSGQVAGFRAAEYICAKYMDPTLDAAAANAAAAHVVDQTLAWVKKSADSATAWEEARDELQTRMSKAGAHIRTPDGLAAAKEEAWKQVAALEETGCAFAGVDGLAEALRNRQLCFAHAVYLEACAFAVASGTGSRGSALVADPAGESAHPMLGDEWRFAAENPVFRDQVLETDIHADGTVSSAWVPRRPVPTEKGWFETAWAAFNKGEIYE